MSFTNLKTNESFMDHKEAMEIAYEEFPAFTRNEKKLIGALIQRMSFLESQGHTINIANRKELAALKWVLNEINDFVTEGI